MQYGLLIFSIESTGTGRSELHVFTTPFHGHASNHLFSFRTLYFWVFIVSHTETETVRSKRWKDRLGHIKYKVNFVFIL